jgi:predicted CXXCH cytochrome family protein
MRRAAIAVLSFSSLVIATLPQNNPPSVTIPADVEFAVLLTGGNEQGAIPCGCASDQAGGIAQVAKILGDVRTQTRTRNVPTLIIDLTRSAASPSQEKLLRRHLDQVRSDYSLLADAERNPKAIEYDGATRSITLPLAKVAPGLSGPALPRELVIQVDGTEDAAAPPSENALQPSRHLLKIPELTRGSVQVVLLAKTATGYRLRSRRYTTSNRDATDTATQLLVDAYYGEERKQVDAIRLASLAAKSNSFLCKDCHASEFATWRHTSHAQALRTLVDQKKDVPECLKCHQYDGGGEDTPVNSVECASCHPNANQHAFSPTQFRLRAGDAKAACASCHTQESDPKFHYDQRYRLIEHSLRKK